MALLHSHTTHAFPFPDCENRAKLVPIHEQDVVDIPLWFVRWFRGCRALEMVVEEERESELTSEDAPEGLYSALRLKLRRVNKVLCT